MPVYTVGMCGARMGGGGKGATLHEAVADTLLYLVTDRHGFGLHQLLFCQGG